MINLYPSKMDGEPLEQYQIDRPYLIKEWIEEKAGQIDLSQPQPVSVSINGEIISVSSWGATTIDTDDDVSIVFEAKGGVVSSIGDVLSSVLNTIVSVFIHKPSAGKVDTSTRQRESDDIDLSAIKANQPKLNDTIPERFGLNRVYPDFVVPNHKYFVDSEQYTEIFLCIGRGRYSVDGSQIHIGQTPLPALGSDAEFQVFQPGQDVSGN